MCAVLLGRQNAHARVAKIDLLHSLRNTRYEIRVVRLKHDKTAVRRDYGLVAAVGAAGTRRTVRRNRNELRLIGDTSRSRTKAVAFAHRLAKALPLRHSRDLLPLNQKP